MDHNHNNSSTTPLEPFTWDSGYNIRYSIFLLTGVCVGLPLVVWALGDLRHHKARGERTSVFVMALLLTDLLEMVLSPAMLTYLLLPGATRSDPVFLLFFGVKYCGLHLHQMVALESVFSRTYNHDCSPSFWQIFSILFCLIEGVFLLLCVYVRPFTQTTAVPFSWLLVALILLGVTCKLTFTPTAYHSASPVTVQDEDHMVWRVATLSVLTLYVPFLAFELAQASIPPASFESHANGIFTMMMVVHPAVCLRLLVDPILSVLVLRQLPLDRQRQELLTDDN